MTFGLGGLESFRKWIWRLVCIIYELFLTHIFLSSCTSSYPKFSSSLLICMPELFMLPIIWSNYLFFTYAFHILCQLLHHTLQSLKCWHITIILYLRLLVVRPLLIWWLRVDVTVPISTPFSWFCMKWWSQREVYMRIMVQEESSIF